MSGSQSGKRSYLSRSRRREVLIQAAATLVESRGWQALTMVSLAREVGVSRQLVYQHFASVDQLMVATLNYIFQDVYEQTRDVVLAAGERDLAETIASIQRISMDIPDGRARALWQAISAAGTGDSQIAAVSRRLRHLLVKTTQPLLEAALGISPQQAGPLIWMLIVSFWGIRQMKDAGELGREDALQLHAWLARRVLTGEDSQPPDVLHGAPASDQA